MSSALGLWSQAVLGAVGSACPPPCSAERSLLSAGSLVLMVCKAPLGLSSEPLPPSPAHSPTCSCRGTERESPVLPFPRGSRVNPASARQLHGPWLGAGTMLLECQGSGSTLAGEVGGGTGGGLVPPPSPALAAVTQTRVGFCGVRGMGTPAVTPWALWCKGSALLVPSP